MRWAFIIPRVFSTTEFTFAFLKPSSGINAQWRVLLMRRKRNGNKYTNQIGSFPTMWTIHACNQKCDHTKSEVNVPNIGVEKQYYLKKKSSLSFNIYFLRMSLNWSFQLSSVVQLNLGIFGYCSCSRISQYLPYG